MKNFPWIISLLLSLLIFLYSYFGIFLNVLFHSILCLFQACTIISTWEISILKFLFPIQLIFEITFFSFFSCLFFFVCYWSVCLFQSLLFTLDAFLISKTRVLKICLETPWTLVRLADWGFLCEVILSFCWTPDIHIPELQSLGQSRGHREDSSLLLMVLCPVVCHHGGWELVGAVYELH